MQLFVKGLAGTCITKIIEISQVDFIGYMEFEASRLSILEDPFLLVSEH